MVRFLRMRHGCALAPLVPFSGCSLAPLLPLVHCEIGTPASAFALSRGFRGLVGSTTAMVLGHLTVGRIQFRLVETCPVDGALEIVRTSTLGTVPKYRKVRTAWRRQRWKAEKKVRLFCLNLTLGSLRLTPGGPFFSSLTLVMSFLGP